MDITILVLVAVLALLTLGVAPALREGALT